MRRKNVLFKKITIGVILAIMIPVILVGVIATYKSRVSFEENLKLTSEQAIKNVDDGLTKHLKVFVQQAVTLSANEDIKNFSVKSDNKDENTKRIQSLLKSTKDTTDGVLNVRYATEDDEIILDSGVMSINEFNYKERDWYKQAQKEKNSQYIGKLSNETESLSNSGIKTLSDLIDKAKRTKKNAAESSNIVNEMTKSVDNINYISNVIAGITEQTNLLSLNASIEAARAGEAGKGFAVVAEEIRKLEEESKKSTDEIQSIVTEISTKAMSARVAMEESKEMLETQDEAIKETEDIFNKIADYIVPLTDAIESIKSLNKKMHLNKEDVK